jgi:hypothetical protein
MSFPGRFSFLFCLAAAVLLVACKVYDPLYCDEKTECTDPERPFCDLAGEYPASEGVARTCIADPNPDSDDGSNDDDGADDGAEPTFCTAGEFVQCTDGDTAIYCNEQGSELVAVECGAECDPERQGCFCEPDTSSCSNDQTVHCGSDSQVKEIEPCALGCNDTGERCVDVDPSNGLAGYLDMTDDAPVVVLSNGAVIDTDAGTIQDGSGATLEVPDYQVAAPEGGVAMRVFAVRSLIIGDATVSGERGIAIVSDGDIVIGGHVRILAGSTNEGPCVGAFGAQVDPGTFQADSGPGGGGFGGPGGDGGGAVAGDAIASGSRGGAVTGNAVLVPLHGGCAGGGFGVNYPLGGAGGGAVQLVSRTLIRIENGSGEAHLNAGGKAAGGSGGGILLESPRVIVSSSTSLVANGAGGASPCQPFAQEGSLTTAPAQGGGTADCADSGFGAGGKGGAAAATVAADGESVDSATLTLVIAGGGGGAVGRIRINVPVPSDFVHAGYVSPTASVGSLATR